MTADQFAYWLQGFSELNASPPTAEQWQSIRDHLATVFNKVTPPYLGTPGLIDPRWAPASLDIRPLRAECSAGIVKSGEGHLMC
jgi:hypothetical protein